MTYNVFGGKLNVAQSINHSVVMYELEDRKRYWDRSFDFLGFIVLKSREICFCYLSGNTDLKLAIRMSFLRLCSLITLLLVVLAVCTVVFVCHHFSACCCSCHSTGACLNHFVIVYSEAVMLSMYLLLKRLGHISKAYIPYLGLAVVIHDTPFKNVGPNSFVGHRSFCRCSL